MHDEPSTIHGTEGDLHDRLREAVGDRTFRHIAELTGIHPETVRRYMSGQAPSAEFLSRLSSSLMLSGEWLLSGRGPMKADQVRKEVLNSSEASDLLTALATTVDRLLQRVERLEVFVQSLDTRMRARTRVDRALYDDADGTITGEAEGATDGESDRRDAGRRSGHDPRAAERVGRIARAVAKRPPPAAG
ncbi:MAG: hypothetical protein AAGG07_11065 [Planctomycetota bacterium]